MTYAEPKEPANEPEADAPEVELPSLTERVGYVETFLEETLEQRKASILCRDFYDGHQLDQDEKAKLRKRKQPELVYNLVAPKVNYIVGEEILRRVDPVALPRTLQHDDAARVATDALRFVEEEQRFDVARSLFAKNFFVEGTGGLLKELEQGKDRVYHRLRHVEWDRLIWDPHSRSLLFEDAKYQGVFMWFDLEDAVAQWPDAEDELRGAVDNALSRGDQAASDKPEYSWADGKRKRVQVAELYCKIGDNYYKSCFTGTYDLKPTEPTGYLDENKEKHLNPLRMASCYIDREGRRYGIVHNMISPQRAHNKHKSKLLHLVTAKPVMAERDSVQDPQKFMTEIAKPDGFAETEPGALQNQRVIVVDQMQLATAHLQLVQESKADINGIGPTASSIPDLPASSSGVALQQRRQAASQELGNPFDTISELTKGVFELDWLCIRHHWTPEMWLRVTDDEQRGGYRFVPLNRQVKRAQRMTELMQQEGLPADQALQIAAGTDAPYILADTQRQLAMLPPEQAQQVPIEQALLSHPAMQMVIMQNQVDQMLMDIVIEEAPETAVLAQQQFDTISEFGMQAVQMRPDLGPLLLEFITEVAQVPAKARRKVLEHLRKPPDPQAMQMQQQAQAMQLEQAKAGIGLAQTQAQLNAARAASEQAKVQQSGAKVPSEIERNQAAAMKDAAAAGEKAAGPMPQQMMLPRGGF